MLKKPKALKFGAILTISIILTLGFSISLQSLLASWTVPIDTPPSNNVGDLLIGGSVGVGTNISVVGNSTLLGNVGVGTTTDSNALHIYRQIGDAIVKISTDGIGNPALDISAATGRGSSIFFKESGIEKGYIGHDPTNGALQFGDATNRARIILKEGGNTIFAGNTIDFNGQEIRHASYNPFYINSNDTIQFRINTNSTGGTGEFGVNRGNDNVRVFTIKDSGNIGIGTNAPTQKLDVSGVIKSTGMQMTTGAGAGKVLTSDASGNAIWGSISTGSVITSHTASSGKAKDVCTAVGKSCLTSENAGAYSVACHYSQSGPFTAFCY